MKKKDYLKIAKKNFKSRLIVGTGKYKNMRECAKAIKISGADMVTVAVRRVNIADKNRFIPIVDMKNFTTIYNEKNKGKLKSKKKYKNTPKQNWRINITRLMVVFFQ